MKNIYESYDELASAMTEGGGILHAYNCAQNALGREGVDTIYNDPCMSWQKGIKDFAGWLDHIGAKIEIIDGAEGFYEYIREQGKDEG